MLVPITSKPGSARANKTGAWRTGRKPRWIHKNCVACRLCATLCPEGVVEGDAKNTFGCDYDYCKGCGLCAEMCPKQDIEMIAEGDKL